MITQIFILGSSTAYGVGASTAGWGDLVKQYFHTKMYSDGGVGEKYEVFNFGKSGETIAFVKETFPRQLKDYGRGGKTVALLSVGGNNAKAENEPDNFVSTPEEFEQEMGQLLDLARQHADTVIVVKGGWVDESRVSPKHNPLTGGKSYFSNARREQFNDIAQRLCEQKGIQIARVEVAQEEWIAKYLYGDGLHPNQAGQQLIFDSIKPLLEEV